MVLVLSFVETKTVSNLMFLQSNLHKTTIRRTPQKWSSWPGGCLTKHLYKTVMKQMWLFLAGFQFFPTITFAGIKICNCTFTFGTLPLPLIKSGEVVPSKNWVTWWVPKLLLERGITLKWCRNVVDVEMGGGVATFLFQLFELSMQDSHQSLYSTKALYHFVYFWSMLIV